MAKKVYLENALKGLVDELKEKIKDKKQGDRLSISAYYGNNQKLFRQSEIDASVCQVFQSTNVGLSQVPCGAIGSKIVFQLVDKEVFEKLFTIKENKPVKAETVQAETVQAETVQAETSETNTTPDTVQAETSETNTTPDTVKEPAPDSYTVSAFEQVKALIPSLTAEEKKELVKLLKA